MPPELAGHPRRTASVLCVDDRNHSGGGPPAGNRGDPDRRAGRRQLDRGDPAALLLAGGHAILASVESGPATDEFEALRAIAQQFRAASPSN